VGELSGTGFQVMGNLDGTNGDISPITTFTLTVGGSGSRAVAVVAHGAWALNTAAGRNVTIRIHKDRDGTGTSIVATSTFQVSGGGQPDAGTIAEFRLVAGETGVASGSYQYWVEASSTNLANRPYPMWFTIGAYEFQIK
jgi:hypothetical protein